MQVVLHAWLCYIVKVKSCKGYQHTTNWAKTVEIGEGLVGEGLRQAEV